MISYPDVSKSAIRFHYDLATPFYRLFWGPHIHHGLWEANESPRSAQINLIETMVRLAGIPNGVKVLDVGCGMGGSSIHLARHHQCDVVGITLSRIQRLWATWVARWYRVGQRAHFRCEDAEKVAFEDESFDFVWSVECTEHLFDKQSFFQKVSRWLKPGGRVAICAWLAGSEPLSPEARKLVEEVCVGFLCPSFGTFSDYENWMTSAGMKMVGTHDWTDRVARTWEICDRRVRRTGVNHLAKVVHGETARFMDRFTTLLEAYRTGAMRYGCIIAERSSG